MLSINRIGAIAATVATLFSANAFAETTLFQTADLNDFSTSFEPGGYFVDASRAIGSVFQLTNAVDITSIGGYFSTFSDGSIYGALIKLSGANGLPTAAIDTNSLAHVVFTPTGADQNVALNIHLSAGYYGLVFGSGLFGADGTSALVSSQDTNGSPRLFSGSGVTWENFADNDVRMVVNGNVSAVPEPSELLLMLTGIAALGGVMRRRQA